METSRQWQLAQDAAATYERVLVPAILGPYAQVLVDWSHLQPGETVLDVGCGTGAATRQAAHVVGPSSQVIAIDINPGMLAVAQTRPPLAGAPITWKHQSVYDLNPNETLVDVIISAQVTQFFPDQPRAFATLRRMLKPGGRLCLSAWCGSAENPYFQAQVAAVTRHLGSGPAAGLAAGFSLADPAKIHTLLAEAGFTAIRVEEARRDLLLPAFATFIHQHFLATPVAAAFMATSAETQQAIVADVIAAVSSYQQASGEVIVPFCSHLASGYA